MRGTYFIERGRLLTPKIAELRANHRIVVVYGIRGADKTDQCTMDVFYNFHYDLTNTQEDHMNYDDVKYYLRNESEEPLFRDEKNYLITHCEYMPKILDRILEQSEQDKVTGQFVASISIQCRQLKSLSNQGNDVAFVRFRPMSLWESGDSYGWVSLDSFLSKDFAFECIYIDLDYLTEDQVDPEVLAKYKDFDQYVKNEEYELNSYRIEKLASAMLRGGFEDFYAQKIFLYIIFGTRPAREYILKDICNNELHLMHKKKCDFEELRAVLKAYCKHIGTHDGVSAIIKSMGRKNTLTKSEVSAYLNALEQAYVIDKLDAWQPKLKTKDHVFCYSLNYLADPSLVASSLRISYNKLMYSVEYYDLLHRSTCVRDLKVYADAIGAKLYHYADDSGLKCDAVIVREDGAYGLINFLYGSRCDIDDKAQDLLKLKQKLDTQSLGEPAFCMVINVTEYDPELRDDGVWVVPINCLMA